MTRKSISIAGALLFCISCAPKAPPPPPPTSHVAPKPSFFEHTITFSGETLADIALHYTGRAMNWSAIQSANPGLSPNKLRIGQVILIPTELMITDKPFTKSSLKRVPKPQVEQTTPGAEAMPSAAPTPATSSISETAPTPESAVEPEPTPVATPQSAPTAAPTAEPTVAPTAAPTPEAIPSATGAGSAPAATGGEQDREKLLDELLQ